MSACNRPGSVFRSPAFLAAAVALGIIGTAAACGGAGAGRLEPEQAADRPDASGGTTDPSSEIAMPDTSLAAAQAAQEALTPTVMALPGVVGTAVGLCDDVPCIKVYVTRRDEELMAQIPDMYGGFKVDVEVSGEFEAREPSP